MNGSNYKILSFLARINFIEQQNETVWTS